MDDSVSLSALYDFGFYRSLDEDERATLRRRCQTFLIQQGNWRKLIARAGEVGVDEDLLGDLLYGDWEDGHELPLSLLFLSFGVPPSIFSPTPYQLSNVVANLLSPDIQVLIQSKLDGTSLPGDPLSSCRVLLLFSALAVELERHYVNYQIEFKAGRHFFSGFHRGLLFNLEVDVEPGYILYSDTDGNCERYLMGSDFIPKILEHLNYEKSTRQTREQQSPHL